jgi:hypothetical protein
MTATDLGLRNTFNCSFADTVHFLSHVPCARVYFQLILGALRSGRRVYLRFGYPTIMGK